MANQNVGRPRRPNHCYRKQFDTIQKGIHELIQFVPKVKTLIFDTVETNPEVKEMGDSQFTKETLNAILDKFEKSFPSIENEDYPNTYSLSIRGDMFFFRTKDRISITWEYDYYKLDKGEAAVEVAIIFTEPANKFLVKNILSQGQILIDNGWEKFELYKNRRNEYKKNKNNKFEGNQSSTKIGDSATFVSKEGEVMQKEDFLQNFSKDSEESEPLIEYAEADVKDVDISEETVITGFKVQDNVQVDDYGAVKIESEESTTE